MPSDFGISDLLADEWFRFTEGLSDLSDGAAQRARQAAARSDPRSVSTRTINMPGLDDVFTLAPRPTLTKEQWAVHFRALNAGLPSPLHPELVSEINRRLAVGERIRTSASPEWARAYGAVLTAIDNVQDLLSTVSTVGRIAIGSVARALERGLPDITRAEALLRASERAERQLALRRAAGTAFTEAGEKALRDRVRREVLDEARQRLLDPRRLASRAGIPLLAVVMTAADILNLMTMIAMLAFPGYAAWCAGYRAALAAGVPAGLFGKGLKAIASKSASLNPFSQKGRLDRSRALRTIRPSIYNLMEVAQTTKELFGVGVTFGGIVGFVQDSAFGIEQATRGGPVTVRSPRHAAAYHRLFARELQNVNREQLADLRAAAIVLAWGPFYFDPRAPLTVEERIEAAAAMHAALSTLRPWIESPAMEQALDLAESDGATPPRWARSDSLAILERAGLEVAGRALWPVARLPERLEVRERSAELARLASDGLEQVIFPIRGEVEGQVLAALAARIYERTMILVTGGGDAIRQELTPDYQTVESLCLANRLLHAGDSVELRLEFFSRCGERMEELGSRSLDLAELEQLAAAVGITLIPLRPTDAGPGSPELDTAGLSGL